MDHPDRFLYILGCVAEECGAAEGSWRALRCQPPAVVPAAPPRPTAAAAPPAAAAADRWGLGAGADDAALNFGDLTAALGAMAPPAAAPPKAGRPGAAAAAAAAAEPADPAAAALETSRPRLPAFYLYADVEPAAVCDAAGGGAGHVAELLEAYRTEEGGGGAALPDAAAAPAAAGGEAGGEAWEGEAYEEDAVLAAEGRAVAGAAFLKFARRLARCPDQCARYARGAPPLWPAAGAPPAPAPCGACGAPRAYELSLAPPLIAALGEAAEWGRARGACAAEARRPPEAWAWAAAALAACSASCAGGAAAPYAEEALALAGED